MKQHIAIRMAGQPFVMSERHTSPTLYDKIIALVASAGFTPNIVNTSPSLPGVLTLVESGEGIALAPSGVHHLRTDGLVFSNLLPRTAHVGLSVAWNPANLGPVQLDFLQLVRKNKPRIRRSKGS